MQKLLTLIITVVILYTIIQMKMNESPKDSNTNQNTITQNSSTQETEGQNTEKQQLTGSFLEKTLSSVLINILKTEQGRLFFENIIKPADKPIAGTDYSFKLNNTELLKSMFKIADFDEGTQGPVSCGHIVTAHYKIFDMQHNIVEEQTKTFTLGAKTVIPGLNAIIPGMQIGETRHAIIPAKYYENKQQLEENINSRGYYTVNITLNAAIPNMFINDHDVKVFDDTISYKTPLVCGDMTSFDAKITKLSDGSVIYDSEILKQKISMDIGDQRYPLIFSYALHGKVPVGIRTVIAEGKMFQALGSVKINKIFPKEQLPNNEYFMLEIKNFD